ncbi:MAG: hypothetical protein ACREBE_21535, partial [bacterium]
LGALLGAVTFRKCVPNESTDCFFAPTTAGNAAGIAGAFFGVLGVPIGGVIGALVRTDKWVPAALTSTTQLRIAPSGNGIGARLSIALP